MKQSTLGLIETYGFIGAVEALDVAVKAANVKLISCEFVRAGIVTIVITGDVSSVKAAVEASALAVEKLGVLRNTHVIARAHNEVWDVLKDVKNSNSNEEEMKLEETNEDENRLENSVQELIEDYEAIEIIEEIIQENSKGENNCKLCRTREELESMKVTELRTIARRLQDIPLTKKQIKFCKKEQLVEVILKNN